VQDADTAEECRGADCGQDGGSAVQRPGVKRWCTKMRSWVLVGMLEGKMASLWENSITESRLNVGERGVNVPSRHIGGVKGDGG
jgi:hypothetical protein